MQLSCWTQDRSNKHFSRSITLLRANNYIHTRNKFYFQVLHFIIIIMILLIIIIRTIVDCDKGSNGIYTKQLNGRGHMMHGCRIFLQSIIDMIREIINEDTHNHHVYYTCVFNLKETLNVVSDTCSQFPSLFHLQNTPGTIPFP